MDEEISDGVKILCERMENNPEDFVESEFDPSTLHRKLGKYYYEGKTIEALAKGEPAGAEALWYLNETERIMLVRAYRNMMRNSHTAHVVGKLLEQPAPEVDVAKAIRNANSPLTTGQLIKELTPGLDEMFSKEYERYRSEKLDALKYKAAGRYSTGWDGKPLTDPWNKK